MEVAPCPLVTPKRPRTLDLLLKCSAFGLNDRRLTLTDGCFALTDAACEAKSQNHRADQNEKLFHQAHPKN